MAPSRKYSIAVVPFLNRSSTNNAGELMMLSFVGRLSAHPDFDVVEPGVVRQKMLSYRIIMREGLSLVHEDLLFNDLNTEFIVSGKVIKYDEHFAGGVPNVDFDVWVYERKQRKIVWASRSYNEGGDGVFFFNVGRVHTVGMLASKMAESVVRNMTAKDPGLLQEQAVKRGPFALMREDAYKN
jgi:hypothetical protein